MTIEQTGIRCPVAGGRESCRSHTAAIKTMRSAALDGSHLRVIVHRCAFDLVPLSRCLWFMR